MCEEDPDSRPSQARVQQAMAEDFLAVIRRFRYEWDVTYIDAYGVLEAVKNYLMRESANLADLEAADVADEDTASFDLADWLEEYAASIEDELEESESPDSPAEETETFTTRCTACGDLNVSSGFWPSFCSRCGARVPPIESLRACGHCGHHVPNSPYCGECGASLESDLSSESISEDDIPF